MAAPSKNFTVIADGLIDADSPLTETLMTSLRDNDIHLEEAMGRDFVLAANHDHDDVNSAAVAGASGGIGIAVGLKHMTGVGTHVNICRFKPDCYFMLNTEADEVIQVKSLNHAAGISTSLQSGTAATTDLTDLRVGGGRIASASAFNADNNQMGFLAFKSVSNLVKTGSYTGDVNASQDVTISFKADLIMVWRADGTVNPTIRTASMTGSNSKGMTNGNLFTTGIRAISATDFTVGTTLNVNGAVYDFVALISGSEKGERVQLDSYTGTGSTNARTNSAGFGPQAVIVVSYDTSGSDFAPTFSLSVMNGASVDAGGNNNNFDITEITENGMIVGAGTTANDSGKNYDVIYLLGGTRP